jgi:hypothetical protein
MAKKKERRKKKKKEGEEEIYHLPTNSTGRLL